MSKKRDNRDTPYAKLICEGSINVGNREELRVERLYVKERRNEEIRFSWWKNGGIIIRPMDATEGELIELLKEGIKTGVFTPDFCKKLKQLL